QPDRKTTLGPNSSKLPTQRLNVHFAMRRESASTVAMQMSTCLVWPSFLLSVVLPSSQACRADTSVSGCRNEEPRAVQAEMWLGFKMRCFNYTGWRARPGD